MKRFGLVLIATAVAATGAHTQTEKLDYAAIEKIRDEGLHRSQVMDHILWLSDVYGPRLTSQTDHVSFDNAGIPAFQFLVDRLEYNSCTHHSNMDTVDRVQRDDMVQQATVIAVFAYQAAMRDEFLPRKPLPPPQRAASRATTSGQ